MYLSFYNLEQKPFQISTDPAFLWLGKKHKEALAVLRYGILDNKGFLLLTGDVGTGKTTLINSLLSDLGDEVVVARVPDPGMSAIDFMNFISHAFGMGGRYKHKDSFLIDFSQFLNTAYSQQKKVLLIIDESQRLSSELLEEVRQLSNIEKQEIKLLNIFLIGQNEFNDMLIQPRNRAVRQRIAISYSLSSLDVYETSELIHYRLKVAGGAHAIFSSEAIDRIHQFSRGIPRKINILCDYCLFTGFTEGTTEITAAIVQRCAREFSMLAPYEQNDSSAVWAQVKDRAGLVLNDTAARADGPAENETASVSGQGDRRPSKRQRYGRSVVLALVLLLVGYGLLLPGNREAVMRFGGYGWQYVHAAHLSSLALLPGDVASEGRGVAAVDMQEPAAGVLPGEDAVIVPDVSIPRGGAPDEPAQFYPETNSAATALLAGTFPPAEKVEYNAPAAGTAQTVLPAEPSAVDQTEDVTDDVGTTPMVDDTTVAPPKPQDAEKAFDEIFPNMDRYISENGTENDTEKEAMKEQDKDPQHTTPVDSGRVMDWLLSKRKE